jgi:FkbM family methyltransferase
LEHVFRALRINGNINYCDIGANMPWAISNTAKFYLNNDHKYIGVLVEPDPILYSILKCKRSKDKVVNCGIKSNDVDENMLNFYMINPSTLNTFSKTEAENYKELGYKIKEIQQVKVININTLLKEYFINQQLHFLSIDVEGLDYEILSSLNFNLFRPICICIETINFVKSGMATKDLRILELLEENGYFEFAFTGINSIFIDVAKWNNR